MVLPQDPELTLDKTGTWADGDGDGVADVGEVVNYSVSVTNDGNVTLHDLTVTDSRVTLTRGADAVGNDDDIFDVGEVWTYTGSYTLTQSVIDEGTVHNDATANALGPQDQTATGGDSADVTLPQPPAERLALTKTSSTLIDGDESGGPSTDDPIQYFFTLENNGSDALHNVQLNDALFGTINFTPDSPDANGLLDPGETWFMARTYLTTAADISAGHVENTATVTALDTSNLLVTSNTARWDLLF